MLHGKVLYQASCRNMYMYSQSVLLSVRMFERLECGIVYLLLYYQALEMEENANEHIQRCTYFIVFKFVKVLFLSVIELFLMSLHFKRLFVSKAKLVDFAPYISLLCISISVLFITL